MGNLLVILAGAAGVIGMFGYFLGTCVYTHVQQNELRGELAAENPQMAAAEAALAEADFIPMETKVAEADRRTELAAFRAVAAAFAATVVPGEPIGRIVVPKIGVDVPMVGPLCVCISPVRDSEKVRCLGSRRLLSVPRYRRTRQLSPRIFGPGGLTGSSRPSRAWLTVSTRRLSRPVRDAERGLSGRAPGSCRFAEGLGSGGH